MRKATATYNAPEGDNKVVEMGGVTFFDGKEVELNTRDNAHLISKLPGNQHFDITIGEEEPDEKRRPGRPSKAEVAAREAEAKTVADKAAAARAGNAGLNQQSAASQYGQQQAAQNSLAPKPAAPAHIPPPAPEA